ncbi:MFS transporter, PPP family, 3-phenylpropionic acid transporter [Methylobacterium sp. 174MFSha1.1]|uniref:MFS transporter n=1 Tax=Methylobacterium sp. 174MFSha1.1 TaxID=1502749 RepID=UPI0008F067A0|nr:MFS transporter [Methylobacterium sp. 174MFSha1.1]SFV14784.1 MFS transporter, PPP family, 3-phenylpropionic acid transporter [Methylobacterium sp. 174MFSha1.1]
MQVGAVLPRFLVVYAALYAGYGLTTPFLPALLSQRGLSPTEVGLVLAAGTGIRLAAGPLAGRLADRLAAGRAVLAACAALSGASALLYLAGHGFAGLLLAGLVHAAATAPLAPLADALALPAAGAARFAYGTVRGAGSAAFIAGTLVAGQVTGWLGLAALPVAGALAFAALAGATLRLPGAAAPAGAPVTAGAGLLLRAPGFRRLVAVAALVVGSHAVHDAFAVIRWREAGLSAGTASLLWAEAVAAEVLVFLVLGPPLLARLGPAGALALAAGAGILRWSVAALTVALPALAGIQALHGLTFALLHLAAMRILGQTVPSALAATAQTLYGTLGLGLATTLATLAAGPLYGALGAGAFWVMAASCAAALPLVPGLAASTASGPEPGRGEER